jgi:(E)-4-hydroxy-3-methylbut-2-enyl-diphosphate synthase
MEIKRKKTKEIRIGGKVIGGNNPVLVQSMTKNKSCEQFLLKEEINNLISAGCEIIRVAVTDAESIKNIRKFIKEGLFSNNPVVGDIQFDSRLALDSLKAGLDCIRINPGNIGGIEKTGILIEEAKKRNACIRIGVNSGSVDKRSLKKNNFNIREALLDNTLEYIRFFENCNFYNFKVSAKASSVTDSIYIYRTLSEKTDYPLHLGITESGNEFTGAIKSSVGMGILLNEGIGDTIRVSLTSDPVKEVKAGYAILSSLGLRSYGINLISCPTCGRTKVNLKYYVESIEKITSGIKEPLTVAVMGCIVNGPGEAKDADIGIAFGEKKAAVFVKGKIIKRVNEEDVIELFSQELEQLVGNEHSVLESSEKN